MRNPWLKKKYSVELSDGKRLWGKQDLAESITWVASADWHVAGYGVFSEQGLFLLYVDVGPFDLKSGESLTLRLDAVCQVFWG